MIIIIKRLFYGSKHGEREVDIREVETHYGSIKISLF